MLTPGDAELADPKLAEAGEDLAVEPVAVGPHGMGESPSRWLYQDSASTETRLSAVTPSPD
jgi:hypothetical protein